MEAITQFHSDLMFYVCFITVFVLYMLVRVVSMFNLYTSFSIYKENQEQNKVYFNRLAHHTGLEIIWTLLPTFLLCNIMTASFSLLYSLEHLENPVITIKTIGHQWY
jgi:heme/copper-type cytochrome/quinol oxidase subunit 2